MKTSSKVPSGNVFLALWFGQFVSLIGTDITKFALRVWTYNQTGSVTQFAMITFFSETPALLLSPVVGAYVDRFSRKSIMMYSDLVCCLSTLMLAFLYTSGNIMPWHVYIVNAVTSVFNALQSTAFTASVALLVPKEKLGQYGGLNQLAPALSMLIGPGLTGFLLQTIELEGIFLLEFVTFFIAVTITSVTTIPQPKRMEGSTQSDIKKDIAVAFVYISERPALIVLLYFLAVGHFSSAVMNILMTPLILSFASPSALGTVMSLSGIGALVGSLLVSLWGGPQRKVYGVIGCAFLHGLMQAICGLMQSTVVILMVAFSYMLIIPLVRVCRESIWQRKVPPSIQGRIFAIQRMIGQIALPLASLIAGPLADNIFEPLMADDGLLADSLGPVIGTGKGRGVALLFIVFGLSNAFFCLITLLYKPLTHVEKELPDQM